MRVGIDATCWANRRGYGRFARELLTALLASDKKRDYIMWDKSPNKEQRN